MRTILKSVFTAAAFCAALSAGFAAPGPDMAASLRIEKINNAFKQVSLEVSGFGGPVKVTLAEEKGEILMEDRIPAGNAFSKVLDLSNLPAGAYTILVASELRETVQPLRITAVDMILNEDMRREYFAPVLRLRERDLDINWFNTRVADVGIAIFEADGPEIFRDKIHNVTRLERRYKLSDLRRGTYTVQISTPYKMYNQTITLK